MKKADIRDEGPAEDCSRVPEIPVLSAAVRAVQLPVRGICSVGIPYLSLVAGNWKLGKLECN
jgi:hypothetical protein